MEAETKVEQVRQRVYRAAAERNEIQQASHEFTRLSRNEDTTQKSFTRHNKYTRGNETNTANDTMDVWGVYYDHRLPSYRIGAD